MISMSLACKKARYIPSGAFTGADVQGLGGGNKEGQAEDMLV